MRTSSCEMGDPMLQSGGLDIEKERNEFLGAFDLVLEHLEREIRLHGVPEKFSRYLKRVCCDPL